MRLRRMWTIAAVALCGLIAGIVPATTTNAAAAPYCGITWGSNPKSGGMGSLASLVTTRTGQHECFDRLVFEFDAPADGYDVHYGEAYTQGRGLPMSPYTAGGAVLSVVLRVNVFTGPRTGDHMVNVLGYQTLRDVVFGGSFENYSTFAVGVRARLPYLVLVLPGPGGHSRIVIDVAHRWEA